jgi:hypothetical protein
LERRHPQFGLIDPRVDILAFLASVKQKAEGRVSANAMRGLRPCRDVRLFNYNELSMHLIESTTVYDERSRHLVLPAELERTVLCEADDYKLARFAADVTDDDSRRTLEEDDALFRRAVHDLKLMRDGPDFGRIFIRPDSPYFSRLVSMFLPTTFELRQSRLRVEPEVVFDSPRTHLEKRKNITRSPIARNVLGGAANALTPAEDAVASRQELIDKCTLVIDDDEILGDRPWL